MTFSLSFRGKFGVSRWRRSGCSSRLSGRWLLCSRCSYRRHRSGLCCCILLGRRCSGCGRGRRCRCSCGRARAALSDIGLLGNSLGLIVGFVCLPFFLADFGRLRLCKYGRRVLASWLARLCRRDAPVLSKFGHLRDDVDFMLIFLNEHCTCIPPRSGPGYSDLQHSPLRI